MNGVRCFRQRNTFPTVPEGIILESVLEGLAEYYSANLSQNIKRGMRESALKCQFNGSGLDRIYRRCGSQISHRPRWCGRRANDF